MFALYWGVKSDIRTLNPIPATEFSLDKCPMYNSKQVCCNPSFEIQLNRALGFWQDNLAKVVTDLTSFREAIAKLKYSESYSDAGPLERKALDVAVLAFAPVVDLFGLCFDTLLAYLAGMLCFTCDPDWMSTVILDEVGAAVGYRVDPAAFDAVWSSCSVWSKHVRILMLRVSDSQLTKRAPLPFPDLAPFASKSSLANYLQACGLRLLLPSADMVIAGGPAPKLDANHPEADGAPLQHVNYTRRLAVLPDNARFIDPVSIGLNSGFETRVFPIDKAAMVGHAAGLALAAAVLMSS
jgi:hypothetical protein